MRIGFPSIQSQSHFLIRSRSLSSRQRQTPAPARNHRINPNLNPILPLRRPFSLFALSKLKLLPSLFNMNKEKEINPNKRSLPQEEAGSSQDPTSNPQPTAGEKSTSTSSIDNPESNSNSNSEPEKNAKRVRLTSPTSDNCVSSSNPGTDHVEEEEEVNSAKRGGAGRDANSKREKKDKSRPKSKGRDHRRDLNQNANAKDRKSWVEQLPEGTANKNQKSANEGEQQADEEADADGEGRLPKRKVAVYFGYCGIGYSGLQINPGVKTIEGDIFDAFCKAGSVSKENAINPAKVGLQRAARTDRGVHAAGNLLTLKLILDPPSIMDSNSEKDSSNQDQVPASVSASASTSTSTSTGVNATSSTAATAASPEKEGSRLVNYVNSLLPPFIRIWGLDRVQNSFNARTSCDSRQYEYLLPTHVFLPAKPGSQMHGMMKNWLEIELQKKEELGRLESLQEEEAINRGGKAEEGEGKDGDAHAHANGNGSGNGMEKGKEGEKEKSLAIGTIDHEARKTILEKESNAKRIRELQSLVYHPFWEFLKDEHCYQVNPSGQNLSSDPDPNQGKKGVAVVESDQAEATTVSQAQVQAPPSVFSQDLKRKKDWRIGKEQVEKIRKITRLYEGSHNFHNFTIGKDFKDRSARRFMKELTVGEPQLVNGTEWISIKFHGQSFMLHQIRKMIGLVILMARTTAPPSLVSETFGPSRLHIPKAPGLGLLLEQPLFGAYNDRISRNNLKIDNKIKDYRKEIRSLEAKCREGSVAPPAEPREGTEQSEREAKESEKEADRARIEKLKKQIEWDTEAKRDHVSHGQFAKEMQDFKQTFIYDRMCKVEEDTDEFSKWLNCIDVTPGNDFEFLNPKGIIPASAIQKGGHGNEKPKKPKTNPNSTNDSSSSAAAIGANETSKSQQDADVGGLEGHESDDDEDEYLKGNQAEFEG